MNIYINNRIYYAIGISILLFLLAYSFPIVYNFGIAFLIGLIGLSIYDLYTLSNLSKKINVSREVRKQLSLGDEQFINYHIENLSNAIIHYELVDELPHQLQHRKKIEVSEINPHEERFFKYKIQPTVRGEYEFGDIHIFLSLDNLGLIQLRKTIPNNKLVKVYPSFIQMKKYELQIFTKTATMAGIRRIRQVGQNDEFEHIKNYVIGDNVKSINWKATSRRGELMVNKYENSKSQAVYMIVDRGRSMKMPFGGMTLLDYAINTTLVISNIVLKKYDKAGLITFSDKIGVMLNAESKANQLAKISEYLYNQKTGFKESNFELLFYTLRSQISRRSIMLFFTNFELQIDLKRNLKYLKSLNRKHLLVVVLFINTELDIAQKNEAQVMKDIYFKTFAKKALMEKEKIAHELKINGIQVILTKPEDLSINTINKYLEIKAKRML